MGRALFALGRRAEVNCEAGLLDKDAQGIDVEAGLHMVIAGDRVDMRVRLQRDAGARNESLKQQIT